MRGVSTNGHSANYVETEQLVEYDKDNDPKQRYLTAFVQVSVKDFAKVLLIRSVAGNG